MRLFLLLDSTPRTTANTHAVNFPHQALLHQEGELGVLPSNSALTPSPWRLHRPHGGRAQSPKTAPASEANRKPQVLTCTSDRSAIDWASHKPLFGFDNFLEQLPPRTQGNSFITSLLYNKEYDKRYVQTDDKVHRVRS